MQEAAHRKTLKKLTLKTCNIITAYIMVYFVDLSCIVFCDYSVTI